MLRPSSRVSWMTPGAKINQYSVTLGIVQSDPLNSFSLNLSFSPNSSGKFVNFETITINTNVKSTF